MSYQVHVMCRPELVIGFELAGVSAMQAGAPDEAVRRVRALIDAGETGVLLIDEAIYEGLPRSTLALLSRAPLPVVVPFPGPDWTGVSQAETYIVTMLRQAIGYRVRLR